MSQSEPSSFSLISFPAELIDSILSHLSPYELVTASATCRLLHRRATSDTLWRPLVQGNIPGHRLTTSYPFDSYRELYATHNTKWFLPKYKIWFCGQDLVGKLLLARYDQRRGCIEAYQLVAVSHHAGLQNWFQNENHTFEPRVALHVDRPVIKFAAKINPESRRSGELESLQGRSFTPEVPMVVDEDPPATFTNFLLAKPMAPKDIGPKILERFPYGSLWPPPTIPAPDHVIGSPGFDGDPPELRPDEIPSFRSEASEHIFRIRQWIAPSPATNVILGHNQTGARLRQHIFTYSTLDPALYTPTALKPWRGIWVGDYGGHGCEFLLIHQPDDDRPVSDEELGLKRGVEEVDEDWEARRLEKRVHRGSLVGIKLTGDPNVPRGEHSFMAEDLSDDEFGNEPEDGPLQGARIVRSTGHIARTGFQNGRSSPGR